MALVTKVKAANITNLSDARYCAGMGVDWIGFPAAAVDAKTFSEITGWLSGPQWVIELDEQPWPALHEYETQVWQCPYSRLNDALLLDGQLIVQLPVQDLKTALPVLRAHQNRIEAVLLKELPEYDVKKTVTVLGENFSVLIDLESSSYDLAEILHWPVAGIQVYGSSEERPGLKDFTPLADVLEQLETE